MAATDPITYTVKASDLARALSNTLLFTAKGVDAALHPVLAHVRITAMPDRGTGRLEATDSTDSYAAIRQSLEIQVTRPFDSTPIYIHRAHADAIVKAVKKWDSPWVTLRFTLAGPKKSSVARIGDAVEILQIPAAAGQQNESEREQSPHE